MFIGIDEMFCIPIKWSNAVRSNVVEQILVNRLLLFIYASKPLLFLENLITNVMSLPLELKRICREEVKRSCSQLWYS